MKKTLVIIAFSIMFAIPAVQAAGQYKSGKDAYAEWLLLDTCLKYATELKKQYPNVDADGEFFTCVEEAKKHAIKK